MQVFLLLVLVVVAGVSAEVCPSEQREVLARSMNDLLGETISNSKCKGDVTFEEIRKLSDECKAINS